MILCNSSRDSRPQKRLSLCVNTQDGVKFNLLDLSFQALCNETQWSYFLEGKLLVPGNFFTFFYFFFDLGLKIV